MNNCPQETCHTADRLPRLLPLLWETRWETAMWIIPLVTSSPLLRSANSAARLSSSSLLPPLGRAASSTGGGGGPGGGGGAQVDGAQVVAAAAGQQEASYSQPYTHHLVVYLIGFKLTNTHNWGAYCFLLFWRHLRHSTSILLMLCQENKLQGPDLQNILGKILSLAYVFPKFILSSS